jgi:hypothetical protein
MATCVVRAERWSRITFMDVFQYGAVATTWQGRFASKTPWNTDDGDSLLDDFIRKIYSSRPCDLLKRCVRFLRVHRPLALRRVRVVSERHLMNPAGWRDVLEHLLGFGRIRSFRCRGAKTITKSGVE